MNVLILSCILSNVAQTLLACQPQQGGGGSTGGGLNLGGILGGILGGGGGQQSSQSQGPSQSRACVCGVSRQQFRIVGGVTTAVGEFPWQVGIVKTGSGRPFCGGSLVNAQWVLTAAHCTVSQQANLIQVILGEHDYTKADESRLVVKNVAEILLHPQWDPKKISYDFSLLRLDSPVDFALNNHIRPICPPTVDPQPGDTVTASGWGTTEESGKTTAQQLRKVSVDVFSDADCKNFYGATKISDSMFCAGKKQGGQDACQGDSGGPLIYKKPGSGVFELTGVTSWGTGCARPNLPGVYARVRQAGPWVMSKIGPLQCPRGEP